MASGYGGGPVLDRDGEPVEEASTPGEVAPNEWGTTVHEVLEYRLLDLDQLTRYANALDPEIREYALWIVEAMERDSGRYRGALSADEGYPEYTVSTTLEIEGATVIVAGEFDLLYEADGVWNLADYKTTDVHDVDSYAGEKYARQLRTYAWLLERTYDIEVGDLTLLYVGVDEESSAVDIMPVSVEREGDVDEYEEVLRYDLRSVAVEPPEGLSARPTELVVNHVRTPSLVVARVSTVAEGNHETQ